MKWKIKILFETTNQYYYYHMELSLYYSQLE